MPIAACWLQTILSGRTNYGAFSESYIGEPAIDYFTYQLIESFLKGTWVKHENEKMSTFLIRILKSKIGHHLRKWHKDSNRGLQVINSIDLEQKAYALSAANEVNKELDDSDILRNISFSFAEAAVEGDPEAKKFLKAAKETDNYRAISKRMKMTMEDVKVVEKRMIEKVKSCILFAEAEGDPEVKMYLKTLKEDLDECKIAERMQMSEAAVEKVKGRLVELVRSYALEISN